MIILMTLVASTKKIIRLSSSYMDGKLGMGVMDLYQIEEGGLLLRFKRNLQ
jgi:hypothetical protein